jgi:hypothetical protein
MRRRAARLPAPLETATWQHHRASIGYFGITSIYSCDGLEQKVRQLLLLFGARKDARVHASGCAYNDMPAGHSLSVSVDFYALAPESSASAADRQPAAWSMIDVDSRHPAFMAPGDCELID